MSKNEERQLEQHFLPSSGGDTSSKNWTREILVFPACEAVLWATGRRMRKNFTSEQMLYTVRQAESGTPV